MALSSFVATQADRVTRRLGYRVFPNWALNPSQLDEIDGTAETGGKIALPAEAAGYLHRGNQRLVEFQQIYERLDEELKTPVVWTKGHTAQQDLASFRGDNMWVHQSGHQHLTERAYLEAVYYILATDRLGLLDTLTEDGAFGAMTFNMAGRRVSRDLIDSILEIDFLDRHLGIASRNDLSILDIGAGYGRLAHRILAAFPALPIYSCADAIAESSFVCEFNLKFRGLEGRFQIIPAPAIDRVLPAAKVDLAINVHSFSECTLKAVGWWLGRLVNNGVKHLMIVPNACNHNGQLLRNNLGEDMLPVVEQHGYRLIARDSKYLDPEVQKFALNPTCHWLFELKA